MSVIIRFAAENIKRIRAIQITPTGNLVTIGGENAQGKSSIMDAIEMALRGGAAIPTRPLRDGTSTGYVIVQTDEYCIERRFTAAGGSTLIVKGADGVKVSSPQGVLDTLYSHVTLDPLEFTRMAAKEQAATLRKISGIDVAPLDAARKAAYDERTIVNRDITRTEGPVASQVHHDDAPATLQSAAELLAEIEKARAHNEKGYRLRNEASVANDMLLIAEADASDAKQRITDLEKQLQDAREFLAKCETGISEREAELHIRRNARDAFRDIDLTPLTTKLTNLEDLNQKVRENQIYADGQKALAEKRKESEALSTRIAQIDAEKEGLLKKAKLPIKGIAFDENGVTYRGVPFEQASTAERLRVSMAMSLAMNPKLKVCLIRDGSLLDKASLELIGDMAEKAGAQVWMERVSDGEEVSIVIEDGSVKEDRSAQV